MRMQTRDMPLAIVAHELRAPLNVILGWAQMLRAGMLTAVDTGKALMIIEQNAKALSKLIEDLLDNSSIAAGKLRLDIRRVELSLIIENAIQAMRPAAGAKQIHISTALDIAVGAVAGDRDRLQQVVLNLLWNALEFTPNLGSIEVRLARNSNEARIVVRDSGPGISAEFLPHIFDPFTQEHSAGSKRRRGLGLGLAISRHLVELHNGTIHAENIEGHGASFTVALPLWKDLLTLQQGKI